MENYRQFQRFFIRSIEQHLQDSDDTRGRKVRVFYDPKALSSLYRQTLVEMVPPTAGDLNRVFKAEQMRTLPDEDVWEGYDPAIKIRLGRRLEDEIFVRYLIMLYKRALPRGVALRASPVQVEKADEKANTHKGSSVSRSASPGDPLILRWEEVTITISGEEKLRVKLGGRSKTLHYINTGFCDRRNDSKNRLWVLLEELEEYGRVPAPRHDRSVPESRLKMEKGQWTLAKPPPADKELKSGIRDIRKALKDLVEATGLAGKRKLQGDPFKPYQYKKRLKYLKEIDSASQSKDLNKENYWEPRFTLLRDR